MENIISVLEDAMIVLVIISLPLPVLSLIELRKGIEFKKNRCKMINIISFVIYNIILLMDIPATFFKFYIGDSNYILNLFIAVLFFLSALRVFNYIFEAKELEDAVKERFIIFLNEKIEKEERDENIFINDKQDDKEDK